MAGELESATALLEAIADYGGDRDAPRRPKLGTVASVGGGAFIRFDGESTTSGKAYAWLASYTPAVGDRVALLPVGTSYLILGRVATA